MNRRATPVSISNEAVKRYRERIECGYSNRDIRNIIWRDLQAIIDDPTAFTISKKVGGEVRIYTVKKGNKWLSYKAIYAVDGSTVTTILSHEMWST